MSDVAETDPSALRRLGVVSLYWAYRLFVAFVIAIPLAVLAGHTVEHPAGDAALFEPGGLLMLEAERLARRSVPPLAAASATVAIVAAIAGLIPFAALVASLATRGRPRLTWLAARGVRNFGTLALLFGIFTAIEALGAILVALLGNKIVDGLGLALPRDDYARIVAIAIGLVMALVAGIVHDLARIACVTRDLGVRASIATALGTFRGALLSTAGGYAWRGAAGAATIAAAVYYAPPLAPAGSPPAVVAFVVHQAAIFVVVFLRASWLALGIRLLHAHAARVTIADAIAVVSAPPTLPAAVAPPVSPPSSPPLEPESTPMPARDIDTTMKSPGGLGAEPPTQKKA